MSVVTYNFKNPTAFVCCTGQNQQLKHPSLELKPDIAVHHLALLRDMATVAAGEGSILRYKPEVSRRRKPSRRKPSAAPSTASTVTWTPSGPAVAAPTFPSRGGHTSAACASRGVRRPCGRPRLTTCRLHPHSRFPFSSFTFLFFCAPTTSLQTIPYILQIPSKDAMRLLLLFSVPDLTTHCPCKTPRRHPCPASSPYPNCATTTGS